VRKFRFCISPFVKRYLYIKSKSNYISVALFPQIQTNRTIIVFHYNSSKSQSYLFILYIIYIMLLYLHHTLTLYIYHLTPGLIIHSLSPLKLLPTKNLFISSNFNKKYSNTKYAPCDSAIMRIQDRHLYISRYIVIILTDKNQ